jgi:hypothetical protein
MRLWNPLHQCTLFHVFDEESWPGSEDGVPYFSSEDLSHVANVLFSAFVVGAIQTGPAWKAKEHDTVWERSSNMMCATRRLQSACAFILLVGRTSRGFCAGFLYVLVPQATSPSKSLSWTDGLTGSFLLCSYFDQGKLQRLKYNPLSSGVSLSILPGTL